MLLVTLHLHWELKASDTFCLISLYQKRTKGTRKGNALMLIQGIHNLILPQKRHQHEQLTLVIRWQQGNAMRIASDGQMSMMSLKVILESYP